MRPKHFLFIPFLFLLISCATTDDLDSSVPASLPRLSSPRPDRATLRKEDAVVRNSQVSDVQYKLFFNLDESSPDFSGTVDIKFNLKRNDLPLIIDFSEGKVLQLTSRGLPVTHQRRQHFIEIPKGVLELGPQEVKIQFNHPYSTRGTGLYRFKDPEDNRSYVYTNFEPYEANRLFPCFDQPDIKATYTVSAEAPASWTVISNVRETGITLKGSRKYWNFPKSDKFSTYVFALVAGPFHQWSSTAGNIPLRLFVRQSLKQFVNPDDWFPVTKSGFRFFQREFDFNYPFKKYDQIIVPDFNAGAMENVGAVTFSERFVRRSAMTRPQRQSLAEVILHEMAHMWFGNLVTMKWWNDLWLNESFATYLATKALVRSTEFKTGWEEFSLSDKFWAMTEDQMRTTHAIDTLVPSTDDAFANFDSITYGKGGAALRQVNFYLGEEAFKEGVRQYFNLYAFTNATRQDFFRSLQEAAQVPLKEWQEDWIQTPGLSTFAAEWTCANGLIASMHLKALPDSRFPSDRTHRTMVGILQRDGNKLKVFRTFNVSVQTQAEVTDALGETCPAGVLPNIEDHAYAKVQLDSVTLQTMKSHLSEIADPWLRGIVWGNLTQMFRNSELSLTDYASLLKNHLPQETNELIANAISNFVWGTGRYRDGLTVESVIESAVRGPEHKYLSQLRADLEDLYWRIQAGQKDQGLRRIYTEAAIRSASTGAHLSKIHRWLTTPQSDPLLTMNDQDLRWEMLITLARRSYPKAKSLIKAEKARDKSMRGKDSAAGALASLPEESSKQVWFENALKPESVVLARLKAATSRMFPAEQSHLKLKFQPEYEQLVEKVKKSQDQIFLDTVVENFFPITCSEESILLADRMMKNHPDLPVSALKSLGGIQENEEKCLCIRAGIQKSLPPMR